MPLAPFKAHSPRILTCLTYQKTRVSREGGATLIEIRRHDVRQLFHTLDPAPFHEKDLDEAAAYLLEACDEAGSRPLRLVVHLPVAEPPSESARTYRASTGSRPAIVDEGLLILGWVAMWRPMEALLYDWWPLSRRRAPVHRLAAIPAEVRNTQ